MNAFERESAKQSARMNTDFIQVGIVKDNRDPHKMGRLKVWVQGSSSAEDNKTGWITCDYATPFGGRTQGSPNASSYDEFPKSYGFWAVPPDVGTRVFVFFVNGRIEQAYWFGSTFDHLMNSRVPAPQTKVLGESELATPYPVVEFDRNTSGTSVDANYVDVPLVDGLQQQNLLYDVARGTADRSARRQAPATMYGMSSPRGNHFVLDDGYTEDELHSENWDDADSHQDTEYNNPANNTNKGERVHEGIVLRTRSGAQLLISESEGNIFVINRDGTARMEMDAEGNVTILGDKDISIRAKQDINYIAERDMNVEVLGNYNLKVHGNKKTEVTGDTKGLHHGEYINDTDKNIRLYSKESFRVKTDTKLSMNAQGTLSVHSVEDMSLETEANMGLQAATTLSASATDVGINGSSSTKIEGSGGQLSVIGDVSISNNCLVGSDVRTAKVSMNNHNHLYNPGPGAPTPTQPAQSGGGGNSASSPDAPTIADNELADDLLVEVFEPATYEDVVDVNPDSKVNERVMADINQTFDRSLTSLGYVMPVTGKITTNGYWGTGVINNTGTVNDNSGWTIENDNTDVFVIADGYIRELTVSHVVIDHNNGYMSVYRGFQFVFDTMALGATVIQSNTIGIASSSFTFEIRRSGSSIYGFNGTVDPGLFYESVTGTGASAANVTLTGNTPATISDNMTPSNNSNELVKLVEIKSILSALPKSGYLLKPRNKVSVKPIVQNKNSSTVELKHRKPIELPEAPEAIEWVVTNTDTDLLEETKEHEGSAEYQAIIGSYSNETFFAYRDSLGYWTIGYGHLILATESYNNGISLSDADTLLENDLRQAVLDARSIAASYGMIIPRLAQIVLTEMVFQLGKSGTMQFKKMLRALANNDYQKAIVEMKDSQWYRQTPYRVEAHVQKLELL